MKIARANPVTSAPASRPPSASTLMKPTTSGTTTASAPGAIISRSAASVEMSTQRAVVGLAPGAFAQTRDLAELAAHLLDHLLGGPADGVDGQRGEQERQRRAEEEADERPRTSPMFRFNAASRIGVERSRTRRP